MSHASESTVDISVQGMRCATCVSRLEMALAEVPGVKTVTVNFVTKNARVVTQTTVDSAALASAVRDAGFFSNPVTVNLTITDLRCAACVSRVERAFAEVPGVRGASVNLATQRATIEAEFGVDEMCLAKAVEAAGYTATKSDTTHVAPLRQVDQELTALRRSALTAGILTLPVFALEMGSHLSEALHGLVVSSLGRSGSHWLQMLLCGLVLLGPGRGFFTKGVPALLRGWPDMNSLVALGTGAAYAYSAVVTLLPGALPDAAAHVYFEAAAVVASLVLLGRWLEARAKQRSTNAIEELFALQPQTALVQRGEDFLEVPVADILIGDTLKVRPGDSVPTDAEVLEGNSHVDESMMTGEPMAVSKGPGGRVWGGTLNKEGALLIRATATGADTALAKIVQLVQGAQSAKLPIQTLADQVTRWFVPGVLGVALVTFVAWLVSGSPVAFALVNAASVLIVACPCAMGLAVPMSVLVGIGRGARLGLLFRQGDALQTLSGCKVIAFDKTRTLTQGNPKLTRLVLCGAEDRAHVLSYVAAVEAGSEHPLAHAIAVASDAENVPGLKAQGFEAVAGMGVRGRVEGVRVEVGADRFMRSLGVSLAPLEGEVLRLRQMGNTLAFAAFDGVLVAALVISDPLKPTSPTAISALRRFGIEPVMITGDAEATAQVIATEAGISEVVAGVLPEGKVQAIESLRRHHGQVTFVGDGVNDAPGLAVADVGIAIGTGADVAIEAADVALLSGDLRGVAQAVLLSRAVLRNVRQNLFWAFAYNVALVPVAAGVLYPSLGVLLAPQFAAAAMAASSVFVVLNALRLRSVPLDAARAG